MAQTPLDDVRVPAGSEAALAAREQLRARFRRQGVATAVMSGVVYGLFTAFMALAMDLGVWTTWSGEHSGLTVFARTYLLGTLGSGILCMCAALWSLGILTYRGKLGDFFRSLASRPGCIVLGVALGGGPLAMTWYALGLQMAGSIIVPISALCTAIGAVLGHLLFRQRLTPRKSLGVGICLLAGMLIGSTGLTEDAQPQLILGMGFGFLAAFAWGLEGCVGGYVSAIIDTEISNAIRQLTAGVGTFFVLVPILGAMGEADTLGMVRAALSDGPSMFWFCLAGFCAYLTYMLWYKGNAMCGAALGMACNGMFSFWGPFFCWIVMGLCHGREGFALPPVVWLGALVMVAGIFVIALNPLELLRNRRQTQ
jgi:drug/metabolite transporter (DMT)-like permease